MVSSACAVLQTEPERFIIYLLADKRLRKTITDEDTFIKAIELAFKSDPVLRNIFGELRKSKDNIASCLKSMFNLREVQNLIKNNLKDRKQRIKANIKKQRPRLRGKKLTAEVERRLKISVGVSKARQKKLKQINIEEATKPIHVEAVIRGRKVKYRKTKHRKLTRAEQRLILNNVKKNKSAKEIVEIYQKTMKFRTKTSIRRHFYRIKDKYKAGILKASGTIRTSL